MSSKTSFYDIINGQSNWIYRILVPIILELLMDLYPFNVRQAYIPIMTEESKQFHDGCVIYGSLKTSYVTRVYKNFR